MKAYTRSIIFGALFSGVPSGIICLVRSTHLFEKVFIYENIFLLGFVASLVIFLESKENVKIFSIISIMQTMENLVLLLAEDKIISRSRLKETLIFMTCSACLMYFLRRFRGNIDTPNLWWVLKQLSYRLEKVYIVFGVMYVSSR